MVAKAVLWLRDPFLFEAATSSWEFTQPGPGSGNLRELQKPPTRTRWPFSKVPLIYALIFHVIMGEAHTVCPRCRLWNVETDGETGTRRERANVFKDASPVGIARRMGALSTWDIVELLVVEDMREVLGVDLGRVAVDLYARRGLAGQHPHPERQLLALKG